MHTPLRFKGDLRQNQLLAALPADDRENLRANLELIELKAGDVLCESANGPAYVYFPTTSILSLLHVTASGGTSEIAVIGNDGMAGISLFMDAGDMPHQTLVHSPGLSYRLAARLAKTYFGREGPAMAVLLHYMQSLFAQMVQTAAGVRHQTVEQQLCRRLLLALERLPSNEIELTHEWLGIFLGVRRETVSTAASRLRRAGLIHYARGHIAVLDRERLAQYAGDGDATGTGQHASRQLQHRAA